MFFENLQHWWTRRRLALSVARNWRARGCFLDLSDADLARVASFWVEAYCCLWALDGVEAGRRARCVAVADLLTSGLVSGGAGLLPLDGRPCWSVGRLPEVADFPGR